MLAAVESMLSEARRVVAPPPSFTISEWADAERQLSPESSAAPGQWRTSRAEYQRGIMDAVSDNRNREVVVMSSAQIGKTEIVLNVIAFYIAHDGSPILVVQPTLEMGEAFSKDRLAPMIRDTRCLTGMVAEPGSKGSGNTLLHKTFPGGHITIAGANSSPSLASRPIRILLLDEVDRYPPSAGTEGDPVSLARKRTATFWNRRILMTSTPTVKGASRIEQAFEHSDQRRFHVPCPHCREAQVLAWAMVQWPEGQPEAARIACSACGALWDDAERIDAIAAGEWRPTKPFKGVAGFHLWEAYSPWRSLAEIVDDFLKAKPYPETLKAWVNTCLGEPWEDRLGERIASESLASKAEDYAQWTVPAGALLLGAGIDVQHDRLAVGVWGYGPGEEAWVIGHTEILGSPAEPRTWAALDELLARRFPHELGGEVRIPNACVDAGDGVTMGYVLDYCRPRYTSLPRVLAVKGQSQEGKPALGKWTKVEYTTTGKPAPAACRLFPVGSAAVKGWLMGRIRQEGMVHFAADLGEDFYAQLTAERLVTKHPRGMPKREWVKAASARNEALDCAVYAYAAALAGGLKRASWERLRIRAAMAINGPLGDSPAPPPAIPTRPAGGIRRMGRFGGFR